MTSKSENTRRIAKNTLMLYGRMLFSLFVSLYTSRAILAALGESDYGVYNVVGGVVAMFSMITSSLSAAISRFQAYELGSGDKGRLKTAYSASFMIQTGMAVIVFILVELLGVWFLNNRMTIDPDRMGAANFVLHCSLITFLSSMLIVPFSASVVAHEDMGVFSMISIAEVIFKLFIAIFLTYTASSADKLKMYAALLVVSTLLVQISYTVYCRRKYDECRLSRITDFSIFKEILGFAGWNFFGSAATLMSNQGVGILLNTIYGPVVNAARGLANTVNNMVGSFVNSFYIAVDPQIVKSYATGDLEYVRYLLKRSVKFGFFITFMISLPVILEADFLIGIWLVDVPVHTISFVRLVICATLLDVLSLPLGMGQLATGKIRNFQIVNSSVQMLNFVLAYLLLDKEVRPEYTYAIAILVGVMNNIVRLIFTRRSLGISVLEYLFDLYLRLLVVSGVALVIPLFLAMKMSGGWLEFLAVGFVSVAATSVSVLFIGCDSGERTVLKEYLIKMLKKWRILKEKTDIE